MRKDLFIVLIGLAHGMSSELCSMGPDDANDNSGCPAIGCLCDGTFSGAELLLKNNSRTGTIPPQLGNLTALRRLKLGLNSLSGTLPPQLGNLTGLKTLYMYENSMSGTLPPQLGNLAALESVYLYNNSLTGTIPLQLGQLSKLRSVYLSNNSLSGTLPLQLGKLAALKTLSLQFNSLTGTIPSQLGNLTALEIMSLSNNSMTGTIPPQLGKLTALERVKLANCSLTGTIPSQLENLENLTKLTIRDNSVTGTIPPQLGKLSKLHSLTLRDNNLDGTIPVQLGNMTALEKLTLNGNSLNGTIPSQLENLAALEKLTLSENQLSGTIPLQLNKLSALEELYLNNNSLTGTLPLQLGKLANATNLTMHDNSISGTLPPQLGQLAVLEEWKIYDNSLSGTLPLQLGQLSALETLNVYGNSMTGSIPTQLGKLAALKNLSLNGNSLNGTIPSQLGKLTFLESLSLNGNSLSGTISSQLGKLAALELLSLSNNNLAGTLPSQLGELTALESLQLYSTDLTGTIPSQLGKLTFLKELSLYDTSLGGTIPSQLGTVALLITKSSNVTWACAAVVSGKTDIREAPQSREWCTDIKGTPYASTLTISEECDSSFYFSEKYVQPCKWLHNFRVNEKGEELGLGCYTDPAYVDNGNSILMFGCTNEDLPSCNQYEQTSIAFTGDLLRSMEVVPDSFPATSDETPLGGCCSICTSDPNCTGFTVSKVVSNVTCNFYAKDGTNGVPESTPGLISAFVKVQYAPTAPPLPLLTKPEGTASGDLHVHHPGGGSFDFRGPYDGAVCSLFQVQGASLNARFTFAKFSLAPEDPRSLQVVEVHGSHVTETFTTFATTLDMEIARVRVGYGAVNTKRAHVMVDVGQMSILDNWYGSDTDALTIGDVTVHMAFVPPASTKLFLSNARWAFTFTPGTYRNVGDGERRARIDVSIAARADPLSVPVAPHGVIGQGFDGLHIEGKKDNYVPDVNGVFTTYAHGEGAIEGKATDYVIKSEDPFSTAFAFERFDAKMAQPRGTSGLSPVID